jgi:hypothetical protein
MKRYEHKIESVNDMVGPLNPSPTMETIQEAMNSRGQEGWRLTAIIGDQAAVFVREVEAKPSVRGLYMIEPHPDAGYPPCDACGEDAHWDLAGKWCSRHFVEEAERQAEAAVKAQKKAMERELRWRMDQ